MYDWEAEAPAKINLSLDVLARLPSGYHSLVMIMQTVSLADTVGLTLVPEGISLTCQGPGASAPLAEDIPTDARNLAWRAAAAFFKQVPGNGVAIRLIKRIPSAAGLAGGSADAAAVLRGLNLLHGHPLSSGALAELGLTLGADVPYCLHGGTCLAEGVGEILTPLPSFAGRWLVLVKPPFPVSTPWVFRQLNLEALGERPNTDVLIQHIKKGNTAAVAHGMCNMLERVTEPAHPEIAALRKRLLALGALGSRMSGSGPTVFGLFAEEDAARAAHAALAQEWPDSWVACTVDG